MSYGLSLISEPEFENVQLDNYFQNIVAEEGVLERFATEHGSRLFGWMVSLPDGEEPIFVTKVEALDELRAVRDRATNLDEEQFVCGREPFLQEIELAIELAQAVPDDTLIALAIC